MKLFVVFGAVLVLLAGCGGPSHPTLTTDQLPAAAEEAPVVVSPPVASAPVPDYAGTYSVQDSAICQLSIAIIRQATGYTFSCDDTHGSVDIVRENGATYLTFLGLKGQEPAEDISALWQDSVLLIQNYGNSMNEYTRFGSCDAKYLELRR